MPNWITIDANTLNITKHRAGGVSGVEIVEGLSPEEIPDRIRAATDQGRCVIYFEYRSNFKEPRIVIHKHRLRPVTTVVGGHSGRLYELRISDTDLEKFPQHIKSALDALTEDNRFVKRQRHYEAAAEAVSDNADELLQ